MRRDCLIFERFLALWNGVSVVKIWIETTGTVENYSLTLEIFRQFWKVVWSGSELLIYVPLFYTSFISSMAFESTEICAPLERIWVKLHVAVNLPFPSRLLCLNRFGWNLVFSWWQLTILLWTKKFYTYFILIFVL